MQATLDNKDERNLRIYQIPLSGIKMNGSKINYHEFIFSLENVDCNKALKRIQSKIKLEKILDVSLEKLRKRERSKGPEC